MGDSILVDATVNTTDIESLKTLFGTIPGPEIWFCNGGNGTVADGFSQYQRYGFGVQQEAGLISAGFFDGSTTSITHSAAHGAVNQFGLGPWFDGGMSSIYTGQILGRRTGFSENEVAAATLSAPCWNDDLDYNGHLASNTSPSLGLLLGNDVQGKVIAFDLNPTTGHQSVTGAGFDPDAVLFLSCLPDGGPSRDWDGNIFNIGAMDSSGNQWAFATRSDFFGGPVGGDMDHAQRWSWGSTSACILHVGSTAFGNPTTSDQVASFVSLDSDGFTINLTSAGLTSDSTAMQVYALCLKMNGSGQVVVGSGTQGDTSLTAGFEPDTMLFANSQNPSATLNTLHSYCSIGASDGTKQRSTWYGCDTDTTVHENANVKGAINRFLTDACIYMAVSTTGPGPGAATGTVIGAASAAMTSTGANLTWATDNGAGNKFGWIAFTSSSSALVPQRPTVVTGPATGGGGSATLFGTITPNRVGSVYYQFEWGTSTTYTNVTPLLIDGSGFSPTAVSASISGLTVGTTYHYNLCAFTDATRTCAECDGDQSFVAANAVVFRNRFRAEAAGGATGQTGTTSPLVFNNEFKVGQ